MITEKFEFTGYNEAILPAVLWLLEGKTKAVLQITHGMTEHIGRYVSFAREMADHGIAVAGFDLRGHGETSADSSVATLGEGGLGSRHRRYEMFL